MNFFRLSDNEISSCVGQFSYAHGGKYSASCAYDLGDRIKIRLNIPRAVGAISVSFVWYDEKGENCVHRSGAVWRTLVKGNDTYETALNSSKIGVGLFYFSVEIESIYGKLTAYPVGMLLKFSSAHSGIPRFQLTVSCFEYKAPSQLYGGTIYHIFVDRFARGGEVPLKEGARLIDNWDNGIPEFPEYRGAPLKNNTFYGGTIYGIIDKLDYIASLGVNIIYLSPVFESVSNHKYDTGDYMTVDSMFGSDQALESLINAAKEKGISIILDGVFNHTGDDSRYFNRYNRYDTVGAYQSPQSPYFDWYEFQSYPDKYTAWWGIEILPRINPDNPGCREYFVGKGGVIEKYAKMGILGFRLDVVDELSDSFVESIKKCLISINPDSVLYGEVWEDASNKIAYGKRKRYYLGKELDGVMNYPLRKGIIDYLINGNTTQLRYSLVDVINNTPERIKHFQMNLLGTHDTERILTVLGGESADGYTNAELSHKRMSEKERAVAVARLRMAYTVLATLPGMPTIFYGDEAGLEGYQDPFNRMPYPWGKEDASLIDFYRKVASMRTAHDVYKCGGYKLLHLDAGLLVFARYTKNLAYITVVNNSDEELNIGFDKSSKALMCNSLHSISAYTAEVFVTSSINNYISIHKH